MNSIHDLLEKRKGSELGALNLGGHLLQKKAHRVYLFQGLLN